MDFWVKKKNSKVFLSFIWQKCTLGLYACLYKKCSVYGALHTSKLFHCCVRWNGPIIVKKKWRGGTLTPPRALIACAAKNGLLGQRKIAGKGKKKPWDCNKTRKCHKTRTLYVCVGTLWGQILEKFVFEYTVDWFLKQNKNCVLYICDFMKFDFESAAESSHMVTL